MDSEERILYRGSRCEAPSASERHSSPQYALLNRLLAQAKSSSSSRRVDSRYGVSQREIEASRWQWRPVNVPGEQPLHEHHAKNRNADQAAEIKQQEVDGVSISQPFPQIDDQVPSIKLGRTETSHVLIINNGPVPVELSSIKLVMARPSRSFSLTSVTDSSIPLGSSRVLEPAAEISLCLSCHATQQVRHKARILFIFDSSKVVVRDVSLRIKEDEVAAFLAAVQPYSRSPRFRIRPTRFVRGVAPRSPKFLRSLKQHRMPKMVKMMLSRKEVPPTLLEGLSTRNYCQYFQALLYAEEFQMQIDIQAYNMERACMMQSGEYITLKVSGLSERRPSLIYRDAIYARVSGTSDKEYQGFVHKVGNDEVFLKFNPRFHREFISNCAYNIRFSFSRINLRRAHEAICSATNILDLFCFPSTSSGLLGQQAGDFRPINRSLNTEQLNAVKEIVSKEGAPPYIIYGPPGTGKTVTIIEAILQVRRRNKDAVVLACAPSNSASDLLLQRLIEPVQAREMLRLNAFTRPHDDVPPEVRPYCCLKDTFFSCPKPEDLHKFKVIVCTYLSAAMLIAQGLRPGHFSHIFLDEAGQATEPETMVPIAGLANSDTVVVLAGDHHQLGPIIRSPLALEYGLGRSFLERLISTEPYSSEQDAYRPDLVTKLLRNYRSHPTILEVPSRLFYRNQLVPSADQELVNSLCNWERLPREDFPLFFIGVEGKDDRESTDPSWFNAQEASIVVEIVSSLMEYKKSRILSKDLGVITPYRQQVRKIEKALLRTGINDVKVGSVEQFQGQERRIIIVSTVRSSDELVDVDKEHNLGFITNPKRFNVAVTRAKALLVVIGNPHVLRQDPCWRELLDFCMANQSYTGCIFPRREDSDDACSNTNDQSLSDPEKEDAEWPDQAR